VFEIRFPGEPRVECNRDKLYEAVRQEFPEVRVPNSIPGTALALQPYHFYNPDEDKLLLVAINKFAFSTRNYLGFNAFKTEVNQYMELFKELFHLKQLTRTGLRYVNLIPYTKENGLLPFGRYFRLNVELPPADPSAVLDIKLGYVTPTASGKLTMRLESVVRGTGEEAFILDFDYAKEDNLRFDGLADYLEESHEQTKQFFESIITDEYRDVMKGEIIE
jgi:uncharacterized protein (TIGR04255 family)